MRTLISATCLALALTACSSDEGSDEPDAAPAPSQTSEATSEPAPEPTTEPTKAPPANECEGLTDASSGRPLCEFEAEDTYKYRLAIAKNPGPLLSALQGVAPWLDEGDFSDVISTCKEIDEDRAEPRNAAIRFSGGPGEEVTEDQAVELIALSAEYACP